jgi:hypothetical protein
MDYEPLQVADDEIRLLRLHGSGSDPSSQVSCELEHFSLKAVEEIRPGEAASSHAGGNRDIDWYRFLWGDYVALSYVWGSSDNQREIIVNNCVVTVTKNLEEALRWLRDSPEASAGLMFWVDALCINQDDVVEKSREVKRMGGIYKTARSVMAWLGLEFDGIDEAISLADELDRQSRIWEQPTAYFGPFNRHPDMLAGAARPFHMLLSRPYWKRLWIIQELALGQGDISLVCGDKRLSFEMVARAAQFIAGAFLNLRKGLGKNLSDDEIEELSDFLWRVSQMYSIRRITIENGDGVSMEYLDAVVRLGQHADAGDPRDKVYGLLGLLGSGFEATIIPDYSLSSQQVYACFVRGFITTFSNLNVILLGSAGQRPEGWPSWVPDLGHPSDDDGAVLYTHYRAGGENPLDVSFSDDGLLLRCYGFRIEIGARPVIKPGDTAPPTLPKLTRSNRTGRRLAHEDTSLSRFLASSGLLSTRATAASGGEAEGSPRLSHGVPMPPELKDIGAPGSLEWILSGGARGNEKSGTQHPLTAQAITRSAQAVEEMDIALRSFGQRNIAAFTTGGHLVWAYSGLQENDIVCILLGCSYPLVLRPCGENYKVISECYIYEIMAGEALSKLGDDDTPLEVFSLC